MGMNRRGVITIAAIAAVGVFGTTNHFKDYIPQANNKPAVTLEKTETINFTGNSAGNNAETYTVAVPVAPTKTRDTACYVLETLPWNGMGGLIYANGGSRTQPGSLVDKYTNGGCLEIKLQNDYAQMEAHLANGQDAFYAIMGDGYGYVALAQDALLPGNFEGFGIVGFSDGEDKCIMTADVAARKGRGAVIGAVPEDGDWDICVKWAADNGTPINADGKTYDPDAMNFMDTDTFQHADEALVTHKCEKRRLVKGTLDMKREVTACANGAATWTPGDVDVYEQFDGIVYADGKPVIVDGKPQKLGLVSVASTRDYRGQMPAFIVGRKDFDKQHNDFIVGLLKAADQGAAAINAGDLTSAGYQSNRALMEMGRMNAQVFQDKDADYWARYFVGQVGADQLGTRVLLGGSRVIGLREQADYFGLRPGTKNVMKAGYDIFTGYDTVLRPDLSPKIIPFGSIVNVSYLQQALQGVQLNTGATVKAVETPVQITRVVSNRVWKIEFDTGSANIRKESYATLNELANQASMTVLHIRVDGYTDNTGSAATNTKLSEARAAAVAEWLNATSPADFPMTRFQALGHGPANPVGDNTTPEGKQQNRRVEIAFGD